MQNKEITFSDAIEQVMINNWFYAPLSLIYKEFGLIVKSVWLRWLNFPI